MKALSYEQGITDRLILKEKQTVKHEIELPLEYKHSYRYAVNLIERMRESPLSPTMSDLLDGMESYLMEVAIRHLPTYRGVNRIPATEMGHSRQVCRLTMVRILSELTGVCAALGMKDEGSKLFSYRHDLTYRLEDALPGERR